MSTNDQNTRLEPKSVSGEASAVLKRTRGNKRIWPQRLNTKAKLLRSSFLAVFLLIWELAANFHLVDVRFVSKPTAIFMAIGSLTIDPVVQQAVFDTLVAVGVSFVVGALIGLLLGLALGLNKTLNEAYLPTLVMLIGIPKSVFLPLLILVFGLGNAAGIAFGVLLAFMQVAINVVAGVDSVRSQYYTVARAYGANSFRLFMDVILPGAAPGLFAGLWHGIRQAFIGVVIVQMFVSTIGIGYLVQIYTNIFRVDKALAVVIVVAIVVILVGTAWGRLERRVTSWRTVMDKS